MALTNKDIARDVEFVIEEMKTAEVEIPSFFKCAAPGILFIILTTVWLSSILFGYDGRGNLDLISFGVLISFMIFLVSSQMRSKYFSLPEAVRQKSLIIRLFKRKAIIYSVTWIAINICVGLLFAIPVIVVVFMFISMVFFWFIALLDLGRYDVALLSSAIQTWREGGDLDPLLNKK